MTPEPSQLNWTNPLTWPWLFDVVLVIWLLNAAKPVWNWLQRRRAEAWPIAYGRIESAAMIKPKYPLLSRRGQLIARLAYSYTLGVPYTGSYKREFYTEAETDAFLRDLKGRSIAVRYDASAPSHSYVLDRDVDEMLVASPVVASGPSVASDPVPDWVGPLLWPLIVICGIGLVVSLWVHLGAVMGRRVASEAFFWILHLGIFVVWFPAVLVAKSQVGNLNRKDFWKVVLRGSPVWMRYVVMGFGAYAVVNFLLFMAEAPLGRAADGPPAVVWRGFSGHWMVFYAAALAILYSAAARTSKRPTARDQT